MAGTRSGRVYLTFDDGPDDLWTPKVMDELERAGVRGSFFVLAERAAAKPDLVREIKARGHLVELHGLRHELQTRTPRDRAADELDEALAVLSGAGVRPRRWRPPFGIADWWTPDLAESRGLRLTGASADPRDWSGGGTDEMLAAVEPDLKAGRVLVMHDALGPGAEREDCAGTVALVAPLVEELRRRGLQAGPLDGPAFWWLRVAPAPPADGGLSLEVVAEDDLPPDDHRQVCDLLADLITRDKETYRERGWRRIRPAMRVLARAHGEIVGQVSAMWLHADPGLAVAGLGDGVVREDWRLRGLGSALLRTLQPVLEEQGAEVIIGDTVDLARPLRSIGYQSVPRFAVHYERDGACHWHPRYLWWLREPRPGLRLRLSEGDF